MPQKRHKRSVQSADRLGGLRYVRSSGDGGQWNCSSRPGPEEKDRAAPQGPSLRDTQYVHKAYVTMYIAKERNKGIAQVGILINALLVQ
jgi:hypothetical protein